VHEMIVCSNSPSSARIEFDLYAGVLSDWDGSYGSHLLRAGLRLDNLRFDSGALDVNLIGYRHDSTPAGVGRAVADGVEDLHRLALPFFARFRHDIRHHPISRAAFRWLVAHRERLSLRVFDEVVADRDAHGYHHMEHPVWRELMHHLRALNSPQRDEIPILGFHILQLCQDRSGDLTRFATEA
jgi:hypothetical protein